MPSRHEALQAIRAGIERVDRDLLALLAERLELARRAGEVKRRVHDPIVDPPQEDEVMGRALQWGHEHGVDPEDVRAIMTRVIAMCRGVQQQSG
ncbi:MAG TPA: chorismate mutase [Gemmatimonadaceae bacterium]